MVFGATVVLGATVVVELSTAKRLTLQSQVVNSNILSSQFIRAKISGYARVERGEFCYRRDVTQLKVGSVRLIVQVPVRKNIPLY